MCVQEWAHIATIFTGFVTPILTGFTIFYLYKAFTKQTEANVLLRESQIKQTFQNDFSILVKMIDDLKFHITQSEDETDKLYVFNGRASIEIFAEQFTTTQNHNELLESVYFTDLYFLNRKI